MNELTTPPTLSELLTDVLSDCLLIYVHDEDQKKFLPDITKTIIDWRFTKRFFMIQRVDNIIELYGNLRGHPVLGSELFILCTEILHRWFLKQFESYDSDNRVDSLEDFINRKAKDYAELLAYYDTYAEKSLIDDSNLYQGYDEDINWLTFMKDHPVLLVVIAIHYLDAGVILGMVEQINLLIAGEEVEDVQS